MSMYRKALGRLVKLLRMTRSPHVLRRIDSHKQRSSARARMDGRFAFGVLIAFLLTLWMPAKALPRFPDVKPSRSPATQRKGSETRSNLRIDRQGRNRDLTGQSVKRSLSQEHLEEDEGDAGKGPPSVEVATPPMAGQGQSSSDRHYLNGLVEATSSAKHEQVANIVFLKTHKTASTTLAAIMYRYAVRHDLKLAYFGHSTSTSLKSAAAQTQETGDLVDIMHYHISPSGQYRGTWSKAVEYYRDIMRYPNRINFVTLMREPRSHFISYYYYYIQPTNQLSIEEFLLHPMDPDDEEHKDLVNPLSAEFGVKTAGDAVRVITDSLPDFKLIILAERFDEGLLVLRRMMQWHMIDLTYCVLNETKVGQKRWDGIPFVDRPHFDSLPKQVQEKIDDLTDLDRVLYAAAEIEYEKQMAPYSSSIKEDNQQFQELQRTISSYLDSNSSSLANTMYRSMRVYKETPENYPF